MAQNDPHVALSICLHICGGGGGDFGRKNFSGQNLCSSANICSYTKQRAQHGNPFLQPPPPLAGVRPPPAPQSNFRSPWCSEVLIAELGLNGGAGAVLPGSNTTYVKTSPLRQSAGLAEIDPRTPCL